MADRTSQGYNPTGNSGRGDKLSWKDKKERVLEGGKDKRKKALEDIQSGAAQLRAGYNHMKFTLRGDSDQREFVNTEEAQKSAKKLSEMRKKHGVQEPETQVTSSDLSHGQLAPLG